MLHHNLVALAEEKLPDREGSPTSNFEVFLKRVNLENTSNGQLGL